MRNSLKSTALAPPEAALKRRTVGRARAVMRVAALTAALAIALTSPVLAQPEFPVPAGHHDGRTYFLDGSELYVVDHDTRSWQAVPVPAADTLFHWNGRPDWYSSGVDPVRRAIWFWDRSVGPTLRINLDDLTDHQPVWRRSSHAQFSHAGGLDPRTGRPLVFGGYGYYRAKDFVLTYDEDNVTWVEVPTRRAPASPDTEPAAADAAPGPRMNAILGSTFSDSLVAVIGGTVAEHADAVPQYSHPAEDAWILHLDSGLWARVPFEPWMECPVHYTAKRLGQLPGRRTTGSLYFQMTELCRLDGQEDLTNSVVEWRPAAGEYRVVARIGSVPQPQTLTMIEVPGSGADGATNRSDSVRVGFVSRNPAQLYGGDIIVASAPIDTSAGWIPLAPLPTERRANLWLWALAGLIVVGGAAGAMALGRDQRLSATVYPAQDRLEIARGRTRTSTTLQPHVRLLLEGLAATRNGDDLIDPDDLLETFEERYADLESARAMRNKAYNEANELTEDITGRPLIERIQREDDRRRYMYRLLMPVRVR